MAYLGQTPITGKYSLCDNISSGFNGSTTSFGLTVNGDAVSPGTAANLLVSLGNVIKQPVTDYGVSGSSIVFTSAPANGTAFFATVLGDSYSLGIPSDNSVTPASIAATGDFTFPADIRLKDADGSNYVGFQSASTVASNIVWTLPSADGSSGQVLQTAGNGTLSWATAGGAGTGEQFVKLENTSGTAANDGSNTIAGYEAGLAISDGSDNTFYGQRAGKAVTTGDFCTAVGSEALKIATTGLNNTAIGCYALRVTETGGNNTAIGYNTLPACTTGNFNVAIGPVALYDLTTGGNNVAIGKDAGENISTADSNVFVGRSSGSSTNTGAENVGVGLRAIAGVTSGANNTGIGCKAGFSGTNDITTGSNNTLIGYQASASSATVSNEITLGDSSISTLRCQVTSITALSDRRDKTDINTLDLGLNFVDALKPVKFKWNSREGILKDGTYEAGFIAQDFQEVQKDNDADYLKLVLESNPEKLEAAPGKLIPILVKAIQELSAKVKALESA